MYTFPPGEACAVLDAPEKVSEMCTGTNALACRDKIPGRGGDARRQKRQPTAEWSATRYACSAPLSLADGVFYRVTLAGAVLVRCSGA